MSPESICEKTNAQYDSSVHFPQSARIVKEIPETGQIYRIQLGSETLLTIEDISLPDLVLEATKNKKGRDRLNSVLKLNSRLTPYPWLGKADSCFVSLVEDNGGTAYVLDAMIEYGHHIRNGDPVTRLLTKSL